MRLEMVQHDDESSCDFGDEWQLGDSQRVTKYLEELESPTVKGSGPDAGVKAVEFIVHNLARKLYAPLTHSVLLDGETIELDSAEAKFILLVKNWKTERGPTSTVQRIAMSFAYQQIIGMGDVAIPFIIRELERNADHWFWALSAITGIDPVPQKSKGVMDEMADAWIEWYQANENRWRTQTD
jgi:hypothetical protein